MSEDFNIYEEIDLYLKGKLEGEELEKFSGKLKNPEFRETVELQRIANRIVITKQLGILREQMKTDLTDDNKNGFFKKTLLAIAVLALVTTTIILLVNKKTDPEKNNEIVVRPEKVVVAPAQPDSPYSSSGKKIVRENNLNKEDIPVQGDTTTTSLNLIQEENKLVDHHAPFPEIKDSLKQVNSLDNTCRLEPNTSMVDISPTCSGKTDGSIRIKPEGITGGKGPFRFSINDGKNYKRTEVFGNLAAGFYIIRVKDANECMVRFAVEVSEKKCKEVINQAFNPNIATWKFPIEESEEGTIKIYNKNGRLVYSKDISGRDEWNGLDNYGHPLEEGLYAFVIIFKDWSEQNGYISIMY